MAEVAVLLDLFGRILDMICDHASPHHANGRKRSHQAGDRRSTPALWQE